MEVKGLGSRQVGRYWIKWMRDAIKIILNNAKIETEDLNICSSVICSSVIVCFRIVVSIVQVIIAWIRPMNP